MLVATLSMMLSAGLSMSTGPSITSDGDTLAIEAEGKILVTGGGEGPIDLISRLASLESTVANLAQINAAITVRLNAAIPDPRSVGDTVPAAQKFDRFIADVVKRQDADNAAIAEQAAADGELEERLFAIEQHELLVDGGSLCAVHCKRGEIISAICTSETPTTCAPCPDGSWSPGGFEGVCRTCATCPAGTRQVNPCTSERDTLCEPCPAGTFSTAGNTECAACPLPTAEASCPAGTSMVARCAAATGAPHCVPCGPGTYATRPSTAPGNCTACPACASGVPPIKCGGASRGVCVDPELGFATVGTERGCDAWRTALYVYPDNRYEKFCSFPNESTTGPCTLVEYDIGKAGDAAHDQARACGIRTRNILNLRQISTADFRNTPGLPWRDNGYPATDAGNNLPHVSTWDGDFQFVGGEWRFCLTGIDGYARLTIDGGSAVFDSDAGICPLRSADGCKCGSVVEMTTGVHSVSIMFVSQGGGFQMKLEGCPRALSIGATASKFKLRVAETSLCAHVPGEALSDGESDTGHNTRLDPCAWHIGPSDGRAARGEAKFDFVGHDTADGAELKWTCNGAPGLGCVAGVVYCADFGHHSHMFWEPCSRHPRAYPVMRLNSSTGQIELRLGSGRLACEKFNAGCDDPGRDDWNYCATSDPNVARNARLDAELCNASDARQRFVVEAVAATLQDEFPGCFI